MSTLPPLTYAAAPAILVMGGILDLSPLTAKCGVMVMTEHEIKKQLQSSLGDGLVIIVGCGLSAAEGLPGMSRLAEHLMANVPLLLPDNSKPSWQAVEELLNSGLGIEDALAEIDVTDELNSIIVTQAASLIRSAEARVVKEVLQGERDLAFSHLVGVLPPTANTITVVTTNYDRLLELACELVARRVDTMFVGAYSGEFNHKECMYSFCRGIRKQQGRYYLDYAPRIRVLKPHGSLDWYLMDGRPIRCPFALELQPLIIPPGQTKYRAGYNEPFDLHREQANHAIDRASRYLIVGYGFNDDHLQTHLSHKLQDGGQCLIVTRQLSEAGSELINDCPNVMALTAKADCDNVTVFRATDGTKHDVRGSLWNLAHLVEEVFV